MDEAGTKSPWKRRWQPYVAVGSLGLALAVALGFWWRSGRTQSGPREICNTLQQAGTVSDCRARDNYVEHGLPVPQIARFQVSTAGGKAYRGTIARFDRLRDLERYLAAAAKQQRAGARKIAAAAEIGSDSRTRGEDVLAELVPVQIRNDERVIAVYLVPIYGGPQQAAQGQVDAIRTAVSR